MTTPVRGQGMLLCQMVVSFTDHLEKENLRGWQTSEIHTIEMTATFFLLHSAGKKIHFVGRRKSGCCNLCKSIKVGLEMEKHLLELRTQKLEKNIYAFEIPHTKGRVPAGSSLFLSGWFQRIKTNQICLHPFPLIGTHQLPVELKVSGNEGQKCFLQRK